MMNAKLIIKKTGEVVLAKLNFFPDKTTFNYWRLNQPQMKISYSRALISMPLMGQIENFDFFSANVNSMSVGKRDDDE